jgi:hypothetical protein
MNLLDHIYSRVYGSYAPKTLYLLLLYLGQILKKIVDSRYDQAPRIEPCERPDLCAHMQSHLTGDDLSILYDNWADVAFSAFIHSQDYA